MPHKPKRLVNVKELKPYQAAPQEIKASFQEFFSQGEEQQQQSDQQANQSKLISMAIPLTQTIKKQAQGSCAVQAVINLINQTQAFANQYLLGLYLRVLRSPFGSPDPLTSEERKLFESYQPWERNLYTTGNPLSAPEYRTRLCAMPGRPKYVPPAPMGPMGPPAAPAAAAANPAAAPVPPLAPPGPTVVPDPLPQPVLLPGPAPQPGPAPKVPTRNRWMKRTVEPSDRTTRSKGPPEYGLLPETKRTRTPYQDYTCRRALIKLCRKPRPGVTIKGPRFWTSTSRRQDSVRWSDSYHSGSGGG
jgi:hypothetical protein